MARETKTDSQHPPLATPVAGPAVVAGRYELRGVLGRGSMGTVHAGRDVVLDRPVAVKLFPSASADPQQTARYEQEAQLLARLSHPNLVMVFDAGIDATVDDDPKPYLVMELVNGETLADRIAKGPLPPSEVAGIASQLSTALGYIHRRGIIHRDIKPANILLAAADEPGAPATAKLTDFGIARLVDGARMTMTGFTVGTANYLSPEQLGIGDVGPPSDVYSLGLVLLECLTGTVAYPGHGVEAAVTRLHRPPAIPDSVPDGWTRLLQAMFDKDPAARPTAADIGVAVTGLAQAPPPASSAAPARPVTAETVTTQLLPIPAGASGAHRRPWRRWPLVAAAAAAAVLAVLIAVVANAGGGDGGPATPSYPAVPGQLGSHLQQLQQEVSNLSGSAAATMHSDVLALTRAAAARNWSVADGALTELRSDLAAARALGSVSDARAAAIETTIKSVAADLALSSGRTASPTAPSSKASSARPSPTHTTANKPAPAPKPVPGPGGGGKDDKGPGKKHKG